MTEQSIIQSTRKHIQRQVDDLVSKVGDEYRYPECVSSNDEYMKRFWEIVNNHNIIYDNGSLNSDLNQILDKDWSEFINEITGGDDCLSGANRFIMTDQRVIIPIEVRNSEMNEVMGVPLHLLAAVYCDAMKNWYTNYYDSFDLDRTNNALGNMQSYSTTGKKRVRFSNNSEMRDRRLDDRENSMDNAVNLEFNHGDNNMMITPEIPFSENGSDSKITAALVDSSDARKTIDLGEFKQGTSLHDNPTITVKISDCGGIGLRGLPKQSGLIHYYYSNGELSRDGYNVVSLRRNGHQLLIVLESTAEKMGLDPKRDITTNHDNPYLSIKKDGNISKSIKSHSILQSLNFNVQRRFKSKGPEKSIEYPGEFVDAGTNMGILVDLSNQLS